ncbi:MAG: hypothetical protein NTW38_08680 [Candidatus Aminicenantes bacterium]|nr:hypothetical protein [Candidatus Aminicenantes bacterium]
MRTARKTIPTCFGLVISATAVFALVLSVGPIIVQAGETGNRAGRFQIEIFGGAMRLDPRDLNLRSEYDATLQAFRFDSFLNYWQAQGNILSWSKGEQDERGTIKAGFPLGLRVRYRLSGPVSISVGVVGLRAGRSKNLLIEYNSQYSNGWYYRETLEYSPYTLSLSAILPQVGVHYEKPLSGRLGLEGSLSAGPIFARCRYLSNLDYSWHITGTGFDWPAFDQNVRLEENGSGTGFGLEAAARLNYQPAERWGLFLSAGYAYRKIKAISGEGSEIRDDVRQTWEGSWAVGSEQMVAPWGEATLEFPTAYWPDGSAVSRVRDFALDLSGFQLKAGVFYKF